MLLLEQEPKKISKILHLIGLNYVFCTEFVLGIVYYVSCLASYGVETDLLECYRYFKALLNYYPNSPYLFFVFDAIQDFLLKKTFFNYSSDFINFILILDSEIKKLETKIEKSKLIELKNKQLKLNTIKYEYFVKNIISNTEFQQLVALSSAQSALNDPKVPKDAKIFSLLVLIYYFHKMDIQFLKNKYLTIFNKQYPEYEYLLKKYNILSDIKS
jgi:hypothetical protein